VSGKEPPSYPAQLPTPIGPIRATRWRCICSVLLLAVFVFLLGRALQALPVGTAYAVRTGIGAVGTALMGVVIFGETLNPVRLGGIALVLTGITTLKLAPGLIAPL
jgi:multidrug transporter EmrE-like cation transporter